MKDFIHNRLPETLKDKRVILCAKVKRKTDTFKTVTTS